jgi:hypothetical protein
LQKPIVLKKPKILNVEEREGLLTVVGGERERDRSFAELRERHEQGRQELHWSEGDSGRNPLRRSERDRE